MRALLFASLMASASICSIAAEGSNEEPQGGGGEGDLPGDAKLTQDGGMTRLEISNPAPDAEATYRAAHPDAADEEVKAAIAGQAEPAPKDEPKGDTKDKAKDPAEADKAKGFDFKGTVFEGVSEEMQAKVAPYAAAFQENGTLTDTEVAEAAKATGFSEAAVRQFMAGAQAQSSDASAAQKAAMFKPFGGEESQFQAFQEWTTKEGSVSPAEEEAINSLIQAGKAEAAATLLQPIIDRWQAAGGGAPARDITSGPREQGGRGGGTGAEPFKSMAQQVVAQSDPRYESDPAYRQEVEARIAASTY